MLGVGWHGAWLMSELGTSCVLGVDFGCAWCGPTLGMIDVRVENVLCAWCGLWLCLVWTNMGHDWCQIGHVLCALAMPVVGRHGAWHVRVGHDLCAWCGSTWGMIGVRVGHNLCAWCGHWLCLVWADMGHDWCQSWARLVCLVWADMGHDWCHSWAQLVCLVWALVVPGVGWHGAWLMSEFDTTCVLGVGRHGAWLVSELGSTCVLDVGIGCAWCGLTWGMTMSELGTTCVWSIACMARCLSLCNGDWPVMVTRPWTTRRMEFVATIGGGDGGVGKTLVVCNLHCTVSSWMSLTHRTRVLAYRLHWLCIFTVLDPVGNLPANVSLMYPSVCRDGRQEKTFPVSSVPSIHPRRLFYCDLQRALSDRVNAGGGCTCLAGGACEGARRARAEVRQGPERKPRGPEVHWVRWVAVPALCPAGFHRQRESVTIAAHQLCRCLRWPGVLRVRLWKVCDMRSCSDACFDVWLLGMVRGVMEHWKLAVFIGNSTRSDRWPVYSGLHPVHPPLRLPCDSACPGVLRSRADGSGARWDPRADGAPGTGSIWQLRDPTHPGARPAGGQVEDC